MDAENPNLDEFPLFADAEYVDCVLNEGEMLYIPPKVIDALSIELRRYQVVALREIFVCKLFCKFLVEINSVIKRH